MRCPLRKSKPCLSRASPPSRMTFAQNMEAVAAHCGLVLGSRMDGTPWRRPEGPDDDAPIERMLEELQLRSCARFVY